VRVTEFDTAEGAEFLRLIPGAALFPLTIDGGLPAGQWSAVGPGERTPADDPRQGYGICTGIRSGGVVVIDIDQKNGKDGLAALAELEAEWGELPPTLTVSSPSGGQHRYFVSAHKFQSNAGKIGEGLDIRGEGGYVRIPGSPHPRHPGHFLISRAVRPALLPPRWARGIPLARPAPAPVEVSEAPEDVDPDELRARLTEVAKGRRGPIWESWRAVARGERFVEVGGSVAVDTRIQDMLGALAMELDASPEAFMTLIRPSLSILQADDRCAGNPVYTDDQIRGKWERARAYAAARKVEADAAAGFVSDLRPDRPDPPLIVAYSGAYYVRPPDDPPAYIGPKVRVDLWRACADLWGPSAVTRTTEKGQVVRLSADDLIAAYGVSADFVRHATTVQEPRLQDRVLWLPAAHITVEPVYHAEIEAWIQAYDPTGHLEDWIACVTDLHYAAPALWLTGPPGTGKSMLAAGLAKIWDAIPTPMAKAFAEFNDAMLTCPIIIADEEIPRNHRGYQDTEKLKDLITAIERKINEKHKPIRDVIGAMRVILTSNNTNLIRNSGDLTAEDAQALADRFVHLEAAPGAIAALPDPARVIQDVWIDGEHWIAQHALWLAENRTVRPGRRLRMAPFSESLRQMFLIQPGAGFGVCAALYKWILQAAAAAESMDTDKILWRSGTVYTSSEAVLHMLPDDTVRLSRRAVSLALRRCATDHGRVSVRTPEGPRKLWEMSLDPIRTWAVQEGYGDIDRLDAAVRKLNDCHV